MLQRHKLLQSCCIKGGSKCHIPFSFPGNSSASCAHLSLKSSATEVCVNPTESCINLFPSPSCVLGVFSWVTIPKITRGSPVTPMAHPRLYRRSGSGCAGAPRPLGGTARPANSGRPARPSLDVSVVGDSLVDAALLAAVVELRVWDYAEFALLLRLFSSLTAISPALFPCRHIHQ